MLLTDILHIQGLQGDIAVSSVYRINTTQYPISISPKDVEQVVGHKNFTTEQAFVHCSSSHRPYKYGFIFSFTNSTDYEKVIQYINEITKQYFTISEDYYT